MRPRSRVEKPGNSRQPNRSIVDRNEEDETSWVSPVGGDEKEAPESGPSSGDELQNHAEVEEQQRAKHSRWQGQQNASAKRGSSQQQPSETTPSKLTRKRKAKTEDPAPAEEGLSLSPLSPDARNANFDPDDEDDGQPPSKKAKQSAQKKPARSKE
jgi:hypothetical protein